MSKIENRFNLGRETFSGKFVRAGLSLLVYAGLGIAALKGVALAQDGGDHYDPYVYRGTTTALYVTGQGIKELRIPFYGPKSLGGVDSDDCVASLTYMRETVSMMPGTCSYESP